LLGRIQIGGYRLDELIGIASKRKYLDPQVREFVDGLDATSGAVAF